jgi:hypothetical protein
MKSPMPKVFSWKAFATFVHRQTRYRSRKTAHPLLDAVATELHTGALIRRDKKGNPGEPRLNPLELRKSYLDPDEVNQLAMMKKWRLVWTPTPVVKKPKISAPTPAAETPKVTTVSQQVQSYGWKATLQIEANRLWKEQKSLGVKPVKTTIAKLLHKFAQEHRINGDRGGIPDAESIRTHVLSPKAWPLPD